MTLRNVLTEAAARIARRDAETFLAHLLTRDRAWIFAHPEAELDPAQIEIFRAFISRRAAHEPMQYLTGTKEFFGLTLRVTPDTLIPRPETELLVEAVLDWVKTNPAQAEGKPLRILDVGTGTGAIALALATHLGAAQSAAQTASDITATDISPAALAVARENAERLGLTERIHFLSSDLLSAPELAVAGGFDVIVSNPPYVALSDAATLQPEVVRHEPHIALFAGAEGLDIYRRLIPQAHAALRPHGLLALEFGFGQREPLREFLAASDLGWKNVRFLDDYAGIPRVAMAIRA